MSIQWRKKKKITDQDIYLSIYYDCRQWQTYLQLQKFIKTKSRWLQTDHQLTHCRPEKADVMRYRDFDKVFEFPCIFFGFLCVLCSSVTPWRPAHSAVPTQVATHLRTDKVCRMPGRSRIRSRDFWFADRCDTPWSSLSHWATSPLSRGLCGSR